MIDGFAICTRMTISQRWWTCSDSVWGRDDDHIPAWVFAASLERGALLVGAEADGRLVGFAYSVPGFKRGRAAAVVAHARRCCPSIAASGTGHRLKLAQRERTLAQGLELVEWTFDPLMATNAQLNVARLGAVVEEYLENVYGASASPLHRGAPTDRFVATLADCDAARAAAARRAARPGASSRGMRASPTAPSVLDDAGRRSLAGADGPAAPRRRAVRALVVEIPSGLRRHAARGARTRARLAPGDAARCSPPTSPAATASSTSSATARRAAPPTSCSAPDVGVKPRTADSRAWSTVPGTHRTRLRGQDTSATQVRGMPCRSSRMRSMDQAPAPRTSAADAVVLAVAELEDQQAAGPHERGRVDDQPRRGRTGRRRRRRARRPARTARRRA